MVTIHDGSGGIMGCAVPSQVCWSIRLIMDLSSTGKDSIIFLLLPQFCVNVDLQWYLMVSLHAWPLAWFDMAKSATF